MESYRIYDVKQWLVKKYNDQFDTDNRKRIFKRHKVLDLKARQQDRTSSHKDNRIQLTVR